MDAVVITAICTGLSALLVAIGALVASLRASAAADRTAVVAAGKLEQVHSLVNSASQAQKDEIARLASLVADLSGKRTDAALAEHALRAASPPGGANPPPPGIPPLATRPPTG